MTDIPPQCGRCGKDYALAMLRDDLADDLSVHVDSDPLITTAHEDDGVVFFHA